MDCGSNYDDLNLCPHEHRELVLPIVHASQPIRRMRGGSQAQMLATAEGGNYVVKFQNNPQGRRCLVNELIAYFCAKRLGIFTPQLCLVDVSRELLATYPDLSIHLAHRITPIRAGLHLGSLHPSTTSLGASVFDFLPSTYLQN